MKKSELRQMIREETRSLTESIKFIKHNGMANTPAIKRVLDKYTISYDDRLLDVIRDLVEATYGEGRNDGYAEGAKINPNKSFSYKGGFYK